MEVNCKDCKCRMTWDPHDADEETGTLLIHCTGCDREIEVELDYHYYPFKQTEVVL